MLAKHKLKAILAGENEEERRKLFPLSVGLSPTGPCVETTQNCVLANCCKPSLREKSEAHKEKANQGRRESDPMKAEEFHALNFV